MRKNKVKQKRNKNSEFQCLNMDELAMMQDDSLCELVRNLEHSIEHENDTQWYEIELSYVKREQQIRRSRISAHNEYLKQLSLEDEAERKLEETLPYADLDNSAFIFWNRFV